MDIPEMDIQFNDSFSISKKSNVDVECIKIVNKEEDDKMRIQPVFYPPDIITISDNDDLSSKEQLSKASEILEPFAGTKN